MTKLRWFFVLIMTAAFITAQAAMGLVSAQDSTPLKVLTIYPQGETPLVKQFTVTFNQPMVPLGDMKQEPDKAPVSIEPTIKGSFRWLNVYTLAFEPETPLEGSLTGTVTVKKGARSMSGAVLENDVITSYHLPLIKLIRTSPAEGESGLALRPTIHLVFNQKIEEDVLKAKAYFLTDQAVQIPVIVKDSSIYNKDHRPGEHWTVLVEPAKDLQPDIGFEVVLPSGLVSAVGPIPSRDEIRPWYRTYGPMEVLSVTGYSPQKGAPNDPESGLSIQFSNPVLPKEALKHLKVLPEYDFSLLEEFAEGEYITELWLPGAFKPASLYKFSFLPGLKDKYGQALVGRMEFKVPFGSSRPVLDLQGREGVIENSLDPAYPFQVRNVKQVHLRGYFLEPDQVIPFMVKHKMHHYVSASSDDLLRDAPQAEI
ncbi:MAG: Ig-like domain-containing protein, partial [Pseudomonadota bacterium]